MLKYGFTTGSCAAAAAKAAALMALSGSRQEYISIRTPKGPEFKTAVIDAKISDKQASCAVKKFSGDDPDVTDGMLIFADVRLTDDSNIKIDGGDGIGRVTKAGLQLRPGEAAINIVPRMMIEKEVRDIFSEFAYYGGAEIIISAPMGEKIAEKTFNPRLGITGGISILGTSGIVEPMSEKSLMDTIKAELSVKRAEGGEIIIMAPGNYGADFMKKHYGIDIDKAVKCSNFIGAAVDMAVDIGFKKAVIIGHIGKLVKLAGGIMDTHSRNADCRMEIIAACAIGFTENIEVLRSIISCVTTDSAVDILNRNNILNEVMTEITKKADYYLNKRVNGKIETGLIIFSNEFGILGKTENADRIIKEAKGALI